MSDTMERVENALRNKAIAIDTEKHSRVEAVFDWSAVITLVLPVLMEMLMNCFNDSSKEALEQRLVNPGWWDKFWIERITRKAVRNQKDNLRMGTKQQSQVSSILSEAVMSEAKEDEALVGMLLGEVDNNNIPGFNDWI